MIIEKRRKELIAAMETDGTLDPTCERCEPSYRYEDPADGAARYGTHRDHESQRRASRRRAYMSAMRTLARLAVDEGLTDSADVIADVAEWEIIDDQRAAAQDDARGQADR